MAAAALGAVVIEKHFTLDNSMAGPDHAYAVEPHELRAMVDAIRSIEEVRGDGVKRIDSAEEELRHFAQRSIFATRAVRRGEAFEWLARVAALRSTGQASHLFVHGRGTMSDGHV